LIVQWRSGDPEALQALIPLVYKELRTVAHHYLRGERSGHTLQSTALVHEAYQRLACQNPGDIQNRAHFFAVAARLMRQILVDYARSRGAAKRGADCRIELDEALATQKEKTADVIALDDALIALSQRDAQQCHIVELRYFGGLTLQETAEVLDVSVTTVKREWNMAKAWLSREMRRSDGGRTAAMDKD
jgi:RNA polymerase sigma factor (TIGR02999 family)